MTECFCEEQERNTSQVRAFSRYHQKTWRQNRLVHWSRWIKKPEESLTIQIQGFARRDTEKLSVGGAKKTLIPIEERLGEKHGEEGPQYKERAKGNVVVTLDDAQSDQADADD